MKTESNAEMRELIPLASGLHRDGTIHIYIDEEDSGLRVGLAHNGALWVQVDESKRLKVTVQSRTPR